MFKDIFKKLFGGSVNRTTADDKNVPEKNEERTGAEVRALDRERGGNQATSNLSADVNSEENKSTIQSFTGPNSSFRSSSCVLGSSSTGRSYGRRLIVTGWRSWNFAMNSRRRRSPSTIATSRNWRTGWNGSMRRS